MTEAWFLSPADRRTQNIRDGLMVCSKMQVDVPVGETVAICVSVTGFCYFRLPSEEFKKEIMFIMLAHARDWGFI